MAVSVTLSETFFQQIIDRPVPVDLRAIKLLKKSPLALDLYAWTTYRVSYLKQPAIIPWEALMLALGVGYPNTPRGRANFKRKLLGALRKVAVAYPALRAERRARAAAESRPSPFPIAVTRLMRAGACTRFPRRAASVEKTM
jgi:hypothetical protein